MINEKKVKLQKVKRILTLIFGIIFAILGVLFAFTIGVTDDVATIIEMSLILLCGGVAMIIWAKKRKKLINDLREFMKILSCDENGCLNSISSATNRPIEEIKKEINKLIKLEFLQGVFIDESSNCLVKGNGEVKLKSKVYTPPQPIKADTTPQQSENVTPAKEPVKEVKEEIPPASETVTRTHFTTPEPDIQKQEETVSKEKFEYENISQSQDTEQTSENQFDDGTILLIDNGTSYIKLTNETLSFKSGKEMKELKVSDIESAKLGLFGVTVMLKNNDQEILPTMSKDKYSVWVDTINELVQGKGNYTPLSHETIAEVKKQRKIAIGAAVAVFAAIIVFGTSLFNFGENNNISDNDYYSAVRSIVGKQLKSPSTAHYYDYSIEAEDDYGRRIIFCHCDAQNGFGGYSQLCCWVMVDKVEKDGDKINYTYAKSNVIVEEGGADFLNDQYVQRIIDNDSKWNQPLDD